MRRKSRGNGLIRGRAAPMIQLCPACGQMRIHHPGGELWKCPVPKDVTAALGAFRAIRGPRWKSELCRVWEDACAGITDPTMRGLLQQARNLIGPRRLYKIDLG